MSTITRKYTHTHRSAHGIKAMPEQAKHPAADKDRVESPKIAMGPRQSNHVHLLAKIWSVLAQNSSANV